MIFCRVVQGVDLRENSIDSIPSPSTEHSRMKESKLSMVVITVVREQISIVRRKLKKES